MYIDDPRIAATEAQKELNDIHKKIINKISNKIEEENYLAQQLTSFLSIIKQSNSEEELKNLTATLRKGTVETALITFNKNNKNDLAKLLSLRHNATANNVNVKEDKVDDILELQLKQIFNALGNNNESIATTTGRKGVAISPEMKKQMSEISEDFFNKYLNFLQQEKKETQSRRQSRLTSQNIQSERSGKTDLTISINTSIKKEVNTLLRKCANKNFSIKNTKNLRPDLGLTILRKSLFFALSGAGLSNKKIVDFLNNLGQLQFTNNQDMQNIKANIITHLSHLQYAYELMGFGLGKNKEVDFIIINTPNIIQVYSTRNLLKKVLQQENTTTQLRSSINLK